MKHSNQKNAAPMTVAEYQAQAPATIAPEAVGLTTRITTPADLARALASFGGELAPVFVTLAEGDAISGVYLGRGSVEGRPREDRLTGEVRSQTMVTVILRRSDGVRVEILSAHEINRAIAPLVPGRVELLIVRGRDERRGDVVVTEYRIASRPVTPPVTPP